MSVYLGTAEYETNNKESVLEALAEISSFDCDFSGDNGEDCFWENTKAGRFKSNCAYVVDIVSSLNDVDKIIETFLSMWLDHDTYYGEYKYSICNNVISIAVETEQNVVFI